jgi:acid phosphatase (class B)
VAILASRPDTDGEALRKEWRRLVPRPRFIFAGDGVSKRRYLEDGNFVLYFGDSDVDISEARKAGVFPVRVKRSPQSSYKEDYHPGTMREFVLPLSQY